MNQLVALRLGQFVACIIGACYWTSRSRDALRAAWWHLSACRGSLLSCALFATLALVTTGAALLAAQAAWKARK